MVSQVAWTRDLVTSQMKNTSCDVINPLTSLAPTLEWTRIWAATRAPPWRRSWTTTSGSAPSCWPSPSSRVTNEVLEGDFRRRVTSPRCCSTRCRWTRHDGRDWEAWREVLPKSSTTRCLTVVLWRHDVTKLWRRGEGVTMWRTKRGSEGGHLIKTKPDFELRWFVLHWPKEPENIFSKYILYYIFI